MINVPFLQVNYSEGKDWSTICWIVDLYKYGCCRSTEEWERWNISEDGEVAIHLGLLPDHYGYIDNVELSRFHTGAAFKEGKDTTVQESVLEISKIMFLFVAEN